MRRKLGWIVIVAVLLAQFVLVTSPAQADVTHVVQRGETLGEIAAGYEVPLQSVVDANSLNDPNNIAVGQQFSSQSPPRP